MGFFETDANRLIWREEQAWVWVQPWGRDGLRVQSNFSGHILDLPGALLAQEPIRAEIQVEPGMATLRNGKITAQMRADGHLRFVHSQTGALLLEEPDARYYSPPNRNFQARDGNLFEVQAWFKAQEGERFWGLGQHQHGRLDYKGCVIELQQRNTEIAIPFALSNRGYGFLWNHPGVGRVELGVNATRWVSYGAQQMDYYLGAGDTPAEILARYADVTGHAPDLPAFASGFWQCKLRYETQAELLEVAREYQRRGLPLAVIVADFFNWSHMGDWHFDPQAWPDPSAMTRELEEMGVKLMVSIWPTVSPISENYREMKERGLLIHNERGTDAQHVFIDHGINGPAYFAYYDATHPEARTFIWDKAKRGYYDHGVRLWWLDNDEPDVNPWSPENLRFYLGNGVEVANIYPLLHQQAFEEGMVQAGEEDFVSLTRSTWAGGQRFRSVVWSGDVASTFEDLQAQVRAGLNMGLSGIPWWTMDIGGFQGGDTRTDYFRELIVRWFQVGVFCPIFRLHGDRAPRKHDFPGSGGDNEIWSFGEAAYAILQKLLFLRERMRPYIHEQMRVASATGLPLMRPLFVEFPADLGCQSVEDAWMFGPDLLIAPVLHTGVHAREVYLPRGCDWIDSRTGARHTGGRNITAAAPLDVVPVFIRAGSGREALFAD